MDFIFADEDAGCNTGKGTFRNGEVITGEYHLPDDSEEACETYILLHPECEYRIVEDKDGAFHVERYDEDDWEYTEDEEEEEW